MHGQMKDIRLVLWVPVALAAVALAACIPAPEPTSTPFPTARQLPTAYPTASPTQPPTHTPTATRTPRPPTPTPTPTPKFELIISHVQMMDRTTGWALGRFHTDGENHVLRTTDGGETWHDVSPAPLDSLGWPAFFLDSEEAWAWNEDSGEAWRTQDGGLTWTSVGGVGWLADVWFNDSEHGWRMEATVWGLSYLQFDIDSFATTQDGGQTWEETTPPPGGGYAFVAFPSEQLAWVIRAGFANVNYGIPNLGVPFYVHSTSDGGATWKSYAVPLPPETDIWQGSDGTSYLGGVGNCGIASPAYSSISIWKMALACEEQGWLYTTATQGKTWFISPLPARGEVMEIQFIDPKVGWLFYRDPLDRSHGMLYQTTNGGQSWTLLKSTGWTDIRLNFLDAQMGWGVASTCADEACYGYELVRALVKTLDGGRTWQIVEPELAR